MKKKENNYAFIDSQNLNLSILSLGWKLDFARFRVYLNEKYGVEKAFLFIGYIKNLEINKTSPTEVDDVLPGVLNKDKTLFMSDPW